MNKYINADQFERDCMFDRNCEDMQDVIYKLRDYLAADVVEVIRCKDCKYFNKKDVAYNVDDTELYRCKKNEWWFSPNDFCSKGERKES